jgi:hypothetical protein
LLSLSSLSATQGLIVFGFGVDLPSLSLASAEDYSYLAAFYNPEVTHCTVEFYWQVRFCSVLCCFALLCAVLFCSVMSCLALCYLSLFC